MKERGIELWLEGRRLPDLRRWADNLDNRARIATTAWGFVDPNDEDAVEQEAARPVYHAMPGFCLWISINEIFSNPNLATNPPT